MLSRRSLLKGLMLAGGMALLPFNGGWALAASEVAPRKMVVVLLRGAVDGLSIVAPYKEQNYYARRSSIAIAPPGQAGGLTDLDGFFGLNPSLNSLMPLWQNRTLAFVQASGSPAETRSHFEAQDILETALLNSAMANQGWMNTLTQNLPNNSSPTRAISFSNTLPKIFQGHYNVASIPSGIRRGKNGAKAENPKMAQALDQLYTGHAELKDLYSQGTAARDTLTQTLQEEMEASAKGAIKPDAFVAQAGKAGDMLRQDSTIQLMFMDVGGWDTHIRQGNATGQLATKLQHLSEGLSAMATRMGPETYKNTSVLVMSEFGRTVAENGNAGTDHGHGNVAWLMGGAVRGGKVWGQWPGLGDQQLYKGRDLAVTTDFRSIIGANIAGQFGFNEADIGKIIPGYATNSQLKGLIG